MRFTTLAISIALFITGCNLIDIPGDSPGNPNPTTPPETFDDALALWESKGYDTYTYTLERSCFCFPGRISARVMVRADTVVALEDLRADGEPISEFPWEGEAERFHAIDDLFALIQQAEEGTIDSYSATYDSTFGYPTTLSLDFDIRIADEELYYTARDLHPMR